MTTLYEYLEKKKNDLKQKNNDGSTKNIHMFLNNNSKYGVKEIDIKYCIYSNAFYYSWVEYREDARAIIKSRYFNNVGLTNQIKYYKQFSRLLSSIKKRFEDTEINFTKE